MYTVASPSSDPISGLCSLLGKVNEPSHLLVCGDFDYPDIDWTTNSCSNHCSQLFLDTVRDQYLFQHVETPTTVVQNSSSNVLDLIMTNKDVMLCYN